MKTYSIILLIVATIVLIAEIIIDYNACNWVSFALHVCWWLMLVTIVCMFLRDKSANPILLAKPLLLTCIIIGLVALAIILLLATLAAN